MPVQPVKKFSSRWKAYQEEDIPPTDFSGFTLSGGKVVQYRGKGLWVIVCLTCDKDYLTTASNLSSYDLRCQSCRQIGLRGSRYAKTTGTKAKPNYRDDSTSRSKSNTNGKSRNSRHK